MSKENDKKASVTKLTNDEEAFFNELFPKKQYEVITLTFINTFDEKSSISLYSPYDIISAKEYTTNPNIIKDVSKMIRRCAVTVAEYEELILSSMKEYNTVLSVWLETYIQMYDEYVTIRSSEIVADLRIGYMVANENNNVTQTISEGRINKDLIQSYSDEEDIMSAAAQDEEFRAFIQTIITNIAESYPEDEDEYDDLANEILRREGIQEENIEAYRNFINGIIHRLNEWEENQEDDDEYNDEDEEDN